jgi:hypothetical protein
MESTIRTAVAAGLLLAAASCGAPEDEANQIDAVQSAHHQLRCKSGPSDVPATLAVTDGTCLLDQALGTGVQIYTCSAGAWVLKAPEANLTDRHGRFQGNHFLGPTWQWNDGSKIHAAKTAQAPAPDPTAVAWLLLGVTSEDGEGELADIAHVQRVHTSGGVAPAGACTPEASEVRVPYTADYLFYGPARRW